MKKIFKSLFVMAAASATIIACNKEVPAQIDENNEELVEVTIIAGNPSTESATKTEMEGLTPYWSVGDAIGVTDGSAEKNYKFTTGITARAETASFTGTTSVSSALYAYYPYSSNGVNATNGAKVDIPLTQHPTATSFDGAADIMVAKEFTVDPANTTVEDLEFMRLGAIVKVVLKDKEGTMTETQHPSSVSLTAASNLVGRVYIDLANQSLGELYYNGSGTVTAEYTTATQYELNGTNAAYFIVYPQTIAEGTTLTVSAETENYEISKDITVPAGGIVLEAGKITTLNVSLLASHINAASAGAALPFNDDMSWADNGASDGSTDLVSTIATESSGLYVSASKAYKGKGGLKLGTGSAVGSVTTKELDLSGAFYIAIEAGQYGSDAGNIVVSIDGDAAVISSNDFSGVLYANVVAGTYTNKSKVTIATSTKRAYVYSVNIQSGTYVVPPVINVTSSNPMPVANTASSQKIEYTIANETAATLTAALKDPSATWISNIDYTTTDGEVSFDVAAQAANALARSAVIVLSYDGATDVEVTVNQAAGAGGKTEYTATLAISSGVTANGTLTDDKGNEWTLTAVCAGWTSSNSYIHIGSNSKAATSITLTTSDYNSVDIKEIHVWAAAKASTNVTTKISIDGNLLGTSEVLGNTINSGGTEFSITNSTNESGDITVEISRPSSANGAIYFKKLEVIYED